MTNFVLIQLPQEEQSEVVSLHDLVHHKIIPTALPVKGRRQRQVPEKEEIPKITIHKRANTKKSQDLA